MIDYQINPNVIVTVTVVQKTIRKEKVTVVNSMSCLKS